MQRRYLILAAAALVVTAALVFPYAAYALVIAPPAGPQRVINADAVVVGKVVGIEPQDVMVTNVTYRVAVVKVDDAIRGAKDAKQVRVAFIPPPANPTKLIRPGFRGVQLAVGNTGMFILKKHEKEDFYTLGGPNGYFINSENNKNFDDDVKSVKAIVKIAQDPKAGLKSKDAEEKLIAAAVLVEKYRTFRGGIGKPMEEPIDAAESKQILHVLAEADWKQAVGFGSLKPNPAQLFGRLGVNQNDGFVVPPGQNYQQVVQTWLRDNAEKYRIKRFVGGDTK